MKNKLYKTKDNMFKTKKEIKQWLSEMDIGDSFTPIFIKDDLTVDVYGNVNISGKNLTELPIQFV